MTLTQSDRDAAASILPGVAWDDPDSPDYGLRIRMEIGQEDGHPLVEAFAAHRIASTSALTAENAAKDAEIAALKAKLDKARLYADQQVELAEEAVEHLAILEVAHSKLKAEVERLREALAAARTAAQTPQWFYHPDYTEVCQFSPWDVIDYYDPEPGKHVLEVECARPLPSIWCAVHVRTQEEMDALETDDRVVFSEHPTEEDARAALNSTTKETDDVG